MTEEIGQMGAALRVLHLEDNSWDAELIKRELEDHIPCSITQIYTKKAFEAALEKGGVDLILSDSQLPSFDTLSALALVRETCPTVPFIFVSGTASPATKTEAFLRGATDFIRKDELPRLTHVLHRLFLSKREHRSPEPPEIGVPVIVQCKEYRCLGYLDRKGRWRDFESSLELSDVIDWFDF